MGAGEDGAAGTQRGLSTLLPNFREKGGKNGHIFQNEYSESIQDRQGQRKGHSCSVGGSVVWLDETLHIPACICSALS